MSGFISTLLSERKRLTELQKLHPEIMLEYLAIEHFLKVAGSRTVDEVIRDGPTLSLQLRDQCRQIYEQIIQRKSEASSSEVLIEQWLNRASSPEHGYRTSFGHYISNTRLFDKMGSYWVIRPGHYEDVKPTLWESFAFAVRDETLVLSPKESNIGWGN